jgi:hypothetical protein
MPPKSISFASLHPSVREKLRAKGNEIRASTQRFLHGKLVSERIQAQKDVNRHIKEFRENLEATGFGGASEERGPEVLVAFHFVKSGHSKLWEILVMETMS